MANPARFIPAQPPPQYDAEIFWREMQKLREMSDALADPEFDVKTSAPDKPRRGMLRYADGIGWMPGSGEGLYVYNGTQWIAIGSSPPGDRVRRFFEGQL